MSRRLQLLLPAVLLCFGFCQAQAQAPADAPTRTETEATLNRYCLTCHNAKLKTAGLVLDPAGVAQVGASPETWEKVLHQLRGGTMPPPGAARPDATVYNRI